MKKEELIKKIIDVENKLYHIKDIMDNEDYNNFTDLMNYNKIYIKGFGDEEYSYLLKDDITDLKIKLKMYNKLYMFYKNKRK